MVPNVVGYLKTILFSKARSGNEADSIDALSYISKQPLFTLCVATFQCFKEKFAEVINHDVIDISSDFTKHPCGHQVSKYGHHHDRRTTKFSRQNNANLALSPICPQVSIQTAL
ncbi:hypothetical protein TNCV_2149791 [Trichonephila clavipes]|nr:hypothetical protein TNCV_2149791 [Trichonephila clavipes]